ncbi:MAG: hypothetical protein Q7S01_00190 [bacterium]|nr:hypothetical protein [bacterium]
MKETKAMPIGRQGFISPLLLALIAILVLGGGAYVYVHNKKQGNQPVASSTQATSTAQTLDLKTSPPPQAGMLRYQSSLGFSIDYPEKWRIESATIEGFGSIKEAEKVSGNHFSIYSYPENNSYNPGASVPQMELAEKTLIIIGYWKIGHRVGETAEGRQNICRG